MDKIQGRCIAAETTPEGLRLLIRSHEGIREAACRIEGPEAEASRWFGHVVEVDAEGRPRILTPNRTPERSTKWMDRVLDPRRLRALRVRSAVENGIRDFFRSRGFLETRTPLLVPSPGMEPHIRPMALENRRAYLPTSPEFAMKRLLAGGLERIFQICPAFRDEPNSTTHHPEFTMLEWYRAFAGYEEIMRDVEELFAYIALGVHGRPVILFEGRQIDVTPPWPRLRIRDLFREHLGIALTEATPPQTLVEACRARGLAVSATDTWDDLYFRLWLNFIEPKLPADRAVFVLRYPPSQAALSVVDADPDGTRWARRFEAYAGGLELGNAFEELTDPVEQRKRFVKDMELRRELYGDGFPPSPIDEGFLHALAEGMPPSGGIAMGVDRMVMLFANEPDIDRTLWLPSEWPEPRG